MSFATRLASLGGTRGLATALALSGSARRFWPRRLRPSAAPASGPPLRLPSRPSRSSSGSAGRPSRRLQGAQAAAGTGPMVVQVKAEPSQPEWTKVCGKDQGTNAEICYTTRDFVSDQGQPVLAVALYDVKGGSSRRRSSAS